VPFARVWAASLEVAARLRWHVTEADEQDGRIRARAGGGLLGAVQDVEVRLSLDADGQTRVDLSSGPRAGGRERPGGRHLDRFLARLDGALRRAPPTIASG
jgi:hypothetical protein